MQLNLCLHFIETVSISRTVFEI